MESSNFIQCQFSEEVLQECSFEGCARPVRTAFLCNAHYQQKWKGKTLKPLQNWGEVACSFDGCLKKAINKGLCNGHAKQAQRGVELKPLLPSKVVVKPLRQKELSFAPCEKPGCSQARTPKTFFCYHHNHQRSVYKLSVEQMRSFPTNCEICGAGGKIHVDHDHACCPGKISCGKCVRGYLCLSCNTLLGKAKDSPALLQSLIEYLQKGQKEFSDDN